MRFGLGPLPILPVAGEKLVDVYGEALEHAAAAEWWGFDSVWVGEEPHGHRGANSSSSVVAAALAQRTTHVRVGTMPMLGLSHALYLAEEAACIDNLANGRAIVAAQMPSAEAAHAWRVDPAEVPARVADDLRVLRLAWSPAPFSYHAGRYRIPAENPVHTEAHGLVQLSVQPKPAQLDLPLWITGDREASELARGLDLPYLGPPSLSLDELRELVPPRGELAGVVPLCREVVLATSGDIARERARELLAPIYGEDALALAPGRFLIGDPDEVGEQLSAHADALGVNYVIARVTHPGMSHGEALTAIQLFGQSVLPGFRMYGLPPEIRAYTR